MNNEGGRKKVRKEGRGKKVEIKEASKQADKTFSKLTLKDALGLVFRELRGEKWVLR